MGRTLTLLANMVEAKAHPAEVAVSEVVSPGLRRLVLRSPAFRGLDTEPCDVTAFRVSRNDFRHYTPALLDDDEMTIVVQRHESAGPTPGHDLIEGWGEGDDVAVCAWSSTRAFSWGSSEGHPVVLLGDATVISLAMAMARRADGEGRDLVVVLEVPPADVDAAQTFVPTATIVAQDGEPGAAMDGWLRADAEALRLVDDPAVYLAGHGQSIQRQRALLRDVVGLDRRAIRTQPYWATGKAGL